MLDGEDKKSFSVCDVTLNCSLAIFPILDRSISSPRVWSVISCFDLFPVELFLEKFYCDSLQNVQGITQSNFGNLSA